MYRRDYRGGQKRPAHPFNEDPHDGANREYEVGDVWEIASKPATSLIPPHNEDILVYKKQHLLTTRELEGAIELLMPPKTGDPTVLYEGLLQSTGSGTPLYCQTEWYTTVQYDVLAPGSAARP